MKFGFEREFFVVNAKKEYILCPASVPHDACGYLAEARSEPHSDPLKAAYLLLAEEDRMLGNLPKGVRLKLVDTVELPVNLLRDAMRNFGKSPQTPERGSMLGLDYDAEDKLCRAGMHVHFSNIREVESRDGHRIQVPQIMNMPRIISKLDAAFATEIAAANRLQGLYEMKVHGFEYRSLPATTDVRKVADVLNTL